LSLYLNRFLLVIELIYIIDITWALTIKWETMMTLLKKPINIQVTKWLPKCDLQWLESEKVRLQAKGFNPEIIKLIAYPGKPNNKYSLWR